MQALLQRGASAGEDDCHRDSQNGPFEKRSPGFLLLPAMKPEERRAAAATKERESVGSGETQRGEREREREEGPPAAKEVD